MKYNHLRVVFLCRKLSKRVSVALYGKMQVSAGKILAKEKVLIESATNADEAKQIGKLIEELKILTYIKGKSAYWKKISDEIVFKVPKREVFQPTKNLESLYHQAKTANKELVERTEEFAQNTRGKAGFREGLKSRERALEKINADYNGDASKLLDIAGSKVVYNSVDELYNALKLFDDNFEILKIKDRIQNPINGYRDILMNIKMKNGHIVEFRLHLKEMDEIAEGIGHKLYEQQRSIEAISKTRNLTKEEKIKIATLKRAQLNVYEETWNKIINK